MPHYWCPWVLIVQLRLMNENMWCLVFCSCVSLLRMMVSSFIHVPARDMNSSFLGLYSTPWSICATYSLSSLSLMGIWVGSKSLLLWLLGQMVFLVLDPWGITTLTSTMVELTYTPTNNVKAFLSLQASPASAVFWLFSDCHPNWFEMVSPGSFDLHFSNDSDVELVFHVWPHVCL